jgi:hypothetical protein
MTTHPQKIWHNGVGIADIESQEEYEQLMSNNLPKECGNLTKWVENGSNSAHQHQKDEHYEQPQRIMEQGKQPQGMGR